MTDDGPIWPDTGTPDGGCTGNHNGKIERDELLVVVPTSLTYTMGTGITLDLSGGGAAARPRRSGTSPRPRSTTAPR